MQRPNFNFRLVRKLLLRYTLVCIGDSVSLGVMALVLPGIYFERDIPYWFLYPFIVALGLGLLNALVRPVLIILLLPITFATLGLATLLVNAALLYLMNILVESFVIESYVGAFAGLLVLTLVNTLLGNVVRLGDDYSFYATMMNKFSALTRPRTFDVSDPGLVVLQIDGLGYRALKRAIKRGKMPYLSHLLKRRRFVLRRWFSGLPSQTSAVQAGMFYGSKFDVPGFRWYNKRARRMFVSSHGPDMAAVDESFSRQPRPLLRNGSCINSLLHGGASKKILTVSQLAERDLKQHRASLEDFAIFCLHPYLYTRTMLMMLWDFLVDRAENYTDLLRRRRPRLVRSLKSSFLRAVANSFFREATTYFVVEDIIRGIPAIYTNYVGYDMVAHYGGPDSHDAHSTLTGIDRQIKRVNRAINRHSRKHYYLVVLSDHGQTPSVPFENLYDRSLAELIEDRLKMPLVEVTGHAAELGYFNTLLREMRIVETTFGGRSLRTSRATLERLQRRIDDEARRRVGKRGDAHPPVERAQPDEGVVVCPNGNLAHVYFTRTAHRVTTEDLIGEHPGLLEFLVAHEGIGFVVTTDRNGEHLVMAKGGMRRLESGAIEGVDPLPPYAGRNAVEDVARALIELCGYPNSGDLVINGALRKDRRVVTFEAQRGTHGGLGGDQTDPFIIYPRPIRDREHGVATPVDVHRFLTGLLAARPAP